MDDRTFSTSEAAALLDLTRAEVRGFARAGLDEPGRGRRNEYRFGFRDLVVLRMAARLKRAEIPARRIQRALVRLRGGLETSVAGLHLEALGSHVVVRDGEVLWRADSDQLHLSFDAPGRAGGPPEPRPPVQRTSEIRQGGPETDVPETDDEESASPERSIGAVGGRDATSLVESATRLETADPERALALYERAVETDPECWEALVGLGFLRQELGDLAGAVDSYERAQSLDPDPTVGFNLGVALDGLGRPADAVAAYREALELEPALSDAHYNLSLLHERLGDRSGALRHMIAYREQIRGV